MIRIFYSTFADASMYQGSSYRGFTLLLQLLKVRTAYLLLARICPNYYFYSDDFWPRMYTSMFLATLRRL